MILKIFSNQSEPVIQLFHWCHHLLTQKQTTLLQCARNEGYWCFLLEHLFCEEQELSREYWKHLPVWEVYVRKSWGEIQGLHVSRILKSMFCWQMVADDDPLSSLCIFIFHPPSFCSQWSNQSGVLPSISLWAAYKPVSKVGLVCCHYLSTWLCFLAFHEWQLTYCQGPHESL